MKKRNAGYSLGVLVITIAVMIILTTTALVSLKNMSADRDITNFMNDVQNVEEFVREYYSTKHILPVLYDSNEQPISLTDEDFDAIRTQANKNDHGNYYAIDLSKLERIHLENQNRGYVVNENSLRVYVTNPITYNGIQYYTITDEMKGYNRIYNENADFEILISGNPITWTDKARLLVSIPDLISDTESSISEKASMWTFKYDINGPITADEFKSRGNLFLYGEIVNVMQNGVVSFYAENENGYAKVVNVVVSMIDDIAPIIKQKGDILEIIDNETGVNEDTLYYKIIGYDSDLSSSTGARLLSDYDENYKKYMEEYTLLSSSKEDLENLIAHLREAGVEETELLEYQNELTNINNKIAALNSEYRDFNNGFIPYLEDTNNIAIYASDFASNQTVYLTGVSRKVLSNSGLLSKKNNKENSASIMDSEVPVIKKVGEIFNWYIYNKEQLEFLQKFVNNGNALLAEQISLLEEMEYEEEDVKLTEDSTVYLMRSIDLGAVASSGSTPEEKWETSANEAVKWTPIGVDNTTKKMIATFEGNNHVISGVYINRTDNFSGLFGNASSIHNLTIKDSYIKGGSCTAGIVGALRSGDINNCHNINTTVILRAGNYFIVGGIVGQVSSDTKASNCSNTGEVIGYGVHTSAGYGTRAGGIAGQIVTSAFPLTNCINRGQVTAYGSYVGGIASVISENVENCANFGNIIANGGTAGIGGIVGGTTMNSEQGIIACYNRGNIIVNVNSVTGVGGILGNITDNCHLEVIACYNRGNIMINANNVARVGGIVGDINTTGNSGDITNNYSAGNIQVNGTGGTNVGGVIGRYTTTNFTIDHNYYEIGKANVELNSFGEARVTSDMKTSAFVNLLNTDLSEAPWIITAGKNDGYPILK